MRLLIYRRRTKSSQISETLLGFAEMGSEAVPYSFMHQSFVTMAAKPGEGRGIVMEISRALTKNLPRENTRG